MSLATMLLVYSTYWQFCINPFCTHFAIAFCEKSELLSLGCMNYFLSEWETKCFCQFISVNTRKMQDDSKVVCTLRTTQLRMCSCPYTTLLGSSMWAFANTYALIRWNSGDLDVCRILLLLTFLVKKTWYACTMNRIEQNRAEHSSFTRTPKAFGRTRFRREKKPSYELLEKHLFCDFVGWLIGNSVNSKRRAQIYTHALWILHLLLVSSIFICSTCSFCECHVDAMHKKRENEMCIKNESTIQCTRTHTRSSQLNERRRKKATTENKSTFY